MELLAPTNPACPGAYPGRQPADLTAVFFPMPDVNASFDALITQVTHQFAHGFTFSALYTFSHTIDTASNEIGFQKRTPS